MALRWVRRLGLWLAVVGLGNIAGVAAEGPSPEVAALQKRYLDRYFLLRVDVKIQKADVNRILASTVPPPPKLEALHSTTVITPDGVFYTRDYAQTTEVNADVRPGIDVRGDAQPGDATRQDGSGMTGDVLEIKRESVAVLEQEDLARVIGIEDVAHGYLLTVEGFSAQPVEVDLRVKGAKASAAIPETGFDELFGQLVYLLPEDPEALAAWIDPIWPEDVQQAITSKNVITGMSPLQVLLAWGPPVFINRDPDRSAKVWMFQRGATIRDQLRGQVQIYFSDGRVVDQRSGVRP